jgi:hypothetical protein
MGFEDTVADRTYEFKEAVRYDRNIGSIVPARNFALCGAAVARLEGRRIPHLPIGRRPNMTIYSKKS